MAGKLICAKGLSQFCGFLGAISPHSVAYMPTFVVQMWGRGIFMVEKVTNRDMVTQ